MQFNSFVCFLLLYFTILYWFCHTSTWICHRCTWIPNPEPPSYLPPHTISLGHPRAPAPSILYPASNLDWRFVSYMILYVSMPFSQIMLPSPSLTESKSLFCTSVSLLLSCIMQDAKMLLYTIHRSLTGFSSYRTFGYCSMMGYCCHLSKFHIYALIYCIGVFLSGLLHSV